MGNHQVVVILLFRARPSWSRNDRYTAAHLTSSKPQGSRSGNRRIEAQYRDEPDADGHSDGRKPKTITAGDGEVNENGDRYSSIVQPSRLQENEERNEWA